MTPAPSPDRAESDTPKVAFVGVGVMGEPMCRNLAARGRYRVWAVDRDAAPLERLAAHGVGQALLGDAVAGAAFVLCSLPGGPEVEAVAAEALPLMTAGSMFVDLSTSPVETTRSLASAAADRGIAWIDAPVARTRAAAEAGTLSIMAGGDDVHVRRVWPLFEAMASDITHCGPVGCGQIAKLMNNYVLFQNVVALAEAMTIAGRAGLPADRLLDVVSKGSGDSFALRNHATKAMLPDEFPERAFSADYAQKDLAYALHLAASVGVDTPGGHVAADLLKQTSEAGFGANYWPALIRVVRDCDTDEQPD